MLRFHISFKRKLIILKCLKLHPGLIMTIRTKVAAEENKHIVGLTILDNELFVVSAMSSKVEVYDSMKLSFGRQCSLKTLIGPADLVSCDRNKCLYISDRKDGRQSKEIVTVDPNL